jgi:outer membrane lipoprotein
MRLDAAKQPRRQLMKTIFLAFALLLLTGCAHVFTDRANSMVDQNLSFAQLKKDPNAFIGKFVKVGGIIASTKNTNEGSLVEIVQFKLGSDDIPDESTASGGRFLATSPDYLDSMVYKAGRPVAVIGEVKGSRSMPLDEIEYTYPIIAISEIHVWNKSELYNYPPPYFYGPPYYPYWWYGPPYWYPYGYRYRYW